MTWTREVLSVGRLRTLLEAHRGARCAIRSRDLAMLVGSRERDGRSLRLAINQLIDEGVPVGSATGEADPGYFLITTEEELHRCLAQYQGRIRELERRMARLVRAFREGPRQASLLITESAG